MTLLALITIAVLVCVFCAVNGRRNRNEGRDEGLKIGYESGNADGWKEAHERMAKACNVRPDALNIALIHREVLNEHMEEGCNCGPNTSAFDCPYHAINNTPNPERLVN